MKKLNKKMVTMMILAFMLAVTAVPVSAASMKLNRKSATLQTGQSITLQLKGSKKKAKWTTSNKKVATVNQKGKVTAKKNGKATITARVGKKKLTCRVTVKKAAKKTATSNNVTNTPSNNITNQITYYRGQKTENGITYKVVINSNRGIYVDVTNHSANPIRLGWTGDFYITVKTSQGEYNFPINYLQSLVNTNDTTFQRIRIGDTLRLSGENMPIAGVPQAITIHNVYPLDGNLPIQKIDLSANLQDKIKTVVYETTIALS